MRLSSRRQGNKQRCDNKRLYLNKYSRDRFIYGGGIYQNISPLYPPMVGVQENGEDSVHLSEQVGREGATFEKATEDIAQWYNNEVHTGVTRVR